MSRSSVTRKLRISPGLSKAARPGSLSRKVKKPSLLRKNGSSGNNGSRNVYLAIFTLIGVGILIVIAKIIGFIISLDQPYLSDNSSYPRQYSWDGKSAINLIVKSDYIYTLSFQPAEKEVRIHKIPDQTYVRVPYDFGNWPVKSVYQLGQAENPKIGMQLLMDTIENEIEIPIDGYIIFQDNLAQKPLEEEIQSLRSNFWEIANFINSSKTNLSLSEMITLLRAMGGTRIDKISYKDLGESQVTKSHLLADGSRSLVFDRLKLEPLIKSNFEDKYIRQEEQAIAVVNSTEVFGLAETASRVVDNLGGRVIFTGSIDDNLEETVVLGKSSYSKNRFAQIFAPQCQEVSKTLLPVLGKQKISSCDLSLPSLDVSRADIIIVLGRDFADQLK